MLKKRLTGAVTIRNGLVVQSFGYNRYLPIGKPKVVVENLDRWGCDEIFISPLFKIIKKKGFLNISRFNYLCSLTKKNLIALGGINEKNFNQLNSVNSNGFASISWIKKNRPIFK